MYYIQEVSRKAPTRIQRPLLDPPPLPRTNFPPFTFFRTPLECSVSSPSSSLPFLLRFSPCSFISCRERERMIKAKANGAHNLNFICTGTQRAVTYESSESLRLAHSLHQHHHFLFLCGKSGKFLPNQSFYSLEKFHIIPGIRTHITPPLLTVSDSYNG